MNLNNRLNPHFLFNSLNTISALMYQSTEQADEVLQKLSDILRYSLDKQTEQVTLSHEITICKTYLAIEKARFTDSLQVTWLLDETQVSDIKVPPLLLQPLIENAIKHVKVRPIKLTIRIQIEQDNLVCEVADNGQGFSQTQLDSKLTKQPLNDLGHGLDITAKRLALMNGRLILSNHGGARCRVTLPIKTCES
ncbi:sensor histidine kinase [Pseudoalteromonas sp.]|uniref:sensor histidine kinase n=1 Tax=Pseudoalteromonas sp. TaxID=53249 RepID=UPI00356A8C99